MNRRTFCQGAILAMVPLPAAAEPIHATLFKNPRCSCCEGYAPSLPKNGFEAGVEPIKDLSEMSSGGGVRQQSQGCQPRFGDVFVVEGHGPVRAVHKLLCERPAIAGRSDN